MTQPCKNDREIRYTHSKSWPNIEEMKNLARQHALERVSKGQLREIEKGYLEVPTDVFVGRIDVKMPSLPSIDYFIEREGKIGILKEKGKHLSPLALSAHPLVVIRTRDFDTLKGFTDTQLLREKEYDKSRVDPKIKKLRNEAILVTEDLFNNPSPKNINKSRKVVGSFVHLLMKDPTAYLDLTTLSSHDPYTLQHSVGCAVNSLILGRKIRITDEKDLIDLGMGGLLHDIGKIKVRIEIINKDGPLDELEWEEMREHSVLGYEMIKGYDQLDERTKRAVLEHHEDKSGSGYPYGMPWSEIHLFSKIVGISDIFNALTTNRSYSKARNPFEAFELMKEKLQHKIDDELFRHLVLIYGGDVSDIT